MPLPKKLAVALSVMVVGVGVALFFRKDASPFRFWFSASDDPFRQRVERRVTPEGQWSERGWATQVPSQVQVSRVPVATASIADSHAADIDGQPLAFQRNLSPVGALLAPIDDVVDQREMDARGREAQAVRRAPPIAGAARHVVADGDTLATLAARYLGRAEAYLEIFEANRDVLARPDLLPIGAVLRIPPPRPNHGSDRENFDAETALETVPVPRRRGLVSQ